MRLFACKPFYEHLLKIIRYSAAAFVFLVLLSATYFGLWGDSGAIFLLIAAGLVLALCAGIYTKLTNDAITYEATDMELVKTEGILTKRTTVVPYAKISNVATRRDLLERFFGLGTVFIDTIGGGPNYEIIMRHLAAKDMTRMVGIINDMLQEREKENLAGGATHPALKPETPPAQGRLAELQGGGAPGQQPSQQEAQRKPSVRELPPPIDDFAASERERLELLESEAYTRKEAPRGGGEKAEAEQPMKKARKKPAHPAHRRRRR